MPATQSRMRTASLVVIDMQQAGLRLEGMRFNGYFMAISGGETSKERKPKAPYKNQIAHSGLDKNMPIY